MKQIRMPNLKLWQRILLYIAMVVFAALSLYQVAANAFTMLEAIPIYVMAALTLFSSLYYLILDIIRLVKWKKDQPLKISSNRYVARVQTDQRLRTVLFTVPGTMSNVIFAMFNGFVGIYSRSAWFGVLGAYYILLSIMRIIAVDQERQLASIDEPERRWGRECDVYRRSSILLVLMAVVLVGMVVLLELAQGGKEYPGLTIYVAAAFTFYKIVKSTINVIKVRKKNSPLLAAIRRIGHVDAWVSILTLQTAMFAAFGQGQKELLQTMNGLTGAGVCIIVLFIGIDGIREAIKMKKKGRKKEQ